MPIEFFNQIKYNIDNKLGKEVLEMKLRKIFAGMAASAIAMSTMSIAASADSANLAAPFKAGVCYQTNQWDFRDSCDKEKNIGKDEATFPNTSIGVSGALGYDSSVSVSDVEIQYDGTYTVSIGTSGTLTGLQADDGTTYDLDWQLNDPAPEDGSAEAERFNLLSIGTDLVLDDKPNKTDDVATVNGAQLSFSDVTAEWGGNSYSFDAYAKGDAAVLTICLVNSYDDDGALAKTLTMPSRGDTITVTFTISGLGADPNAAQGGEGEGSGNGNTNSSQTGADNSSSKKSDDSSKGTTSTAGTTKTTTTGGGTAAATGTSDATDTTAATGATAGLVFAGIALAGAAVVVTKRK